MIVKKKYRLTKDRDFKQVIAANHIVKNRVFVLYYLENQLGHPRVGISVSKKIGGAVTRNRIRRQIRVMIDQRLTLTEGSDLLVIVRQDYKASDFEHNYGKLCELIDATRRATNE